MHVLPALFSLESAGCEIHLLTKNKRGKGKAEKGTGQGRGGKRKVAGRSLHPTDDCGPWDTFRSALIRVRYAV